MSLLKCNGILSLEIMLLLEYVLPQFLKNISYGSLNIVKKQKIKQTKMKKGTNIQLV